MFNAEDIDGIPPLSELDAEHVTDDSADVIPTVRNSSRCEIVEDRHIERACYKPLSDRIEVPLQATFTSDESYLRTLLHEMVHSTGHASALNRDLCNAFGSEEYAFEEPIAELGSVFASSQLGFASNDIDSRHYQNHVAYLQSWIAALQEDEAALFRAASKADAAANYITQRIEEG